MVSIQLQHGKFSNVLGKTVTLWSFRKNFYPSNEINHRLSHIERDPVSHIATFNAAANAMIRMLLIFERLVARLLLEGTRSKLCDKKKSFKKARISLNHKNNVVGSISLAIQTAKIMKRNPQSLEFLSCIRWHWATSYFMRRTLVVTRDKEMANSRQKPSDDVVPFFHPT